MTEANQFSEREKEVIELLLQGKSNKQIALALYIAESTKANAYRLDSRNYSIAVVTSSMLEYYSVRGQIRIQNGVYALRNCYPLWTI